MASLYDEPTCKKLIQNSRYKDTQDLQEIYEADLDFGSLDGDYVISLALCDQNNSCTDIKSNFAVPSNTTVIKRDLAINPNIYCLLAKNKKSIAQASVQVSLKEAGWLWDSTLLSREVPLKEFLTNGQLELLISPRDLADFSYGRFELKRQP